MHNRASHESKRKTAVSKKAAAAVKKRIPDFKSDAEEAKFWDTHDITDYLDDLELDTETIFARPEAGLIEFGGPLWRKLVETAHRKRTTPERLVHRWVRERLVQS